MHEIDPPERQTFPAMNTIRATAFSASLLALDAAVHAARVGRQTEGDAADEIGRLSARCARAAQSVSTLIGDSVAQPADAAGKAGQASVWLDVVTQSSGRIQELLQHVRPPEPDDVRGAAGETRVRAVRANTDRLNGLMRKLGSLLRERNKPLP